MVYGLSGTGEYSEGASTKAFLEDEMRNHVSQSMDGIRYFLVSSVNGYTSSEYLEYTHDSNYTQSKYTTKPFFVLGTGVVDNCSLFRDLLCYQNR
ncbi:hypothetical protein TNCV_2789971 [Trichonephila clavipes]|nr:hypothetical protein TNCV_2789971 [Trichonephila clavipes]